MAKRKNLSVSLIPACILILYSVSSISGCRNYFSAVYFSYVFVVMINFWQYVEYEDRYSKTPTSVNRKDVSEHIYQVIHISLWFYGSGFGCQNWSKMTTFKLKMRILWHNADLLERINARNGWPWHCLTTYLKAKKGNKSPETLRVALTINLSVSWFFKLLSGSQL